MPTALSMEMRLEEKGGLPLEMFVLRSQNLKKRAPNSCKGRVRCSKFLVMLIKAQHVLENFEHNEHWEHGTTWLINTKLNVDRDWQWYINILSWCRVNWGIKIVLSTNNFKTVFKNLEK